MRELYPVPAASCYTSRVGRFAFAALLSVSATALASDYQQNRPSNIVEMRAMHALACTCAACNKEPIAECGCDFAAKMRGEVKDWLRGSDLSTPEKRDAAYESVRAAFVAKYGKDVLTPRPQVRTGARMSWLPIAIFGGGLLALVMMTRSSLKRRREPQ